MTGSFPTPPMNPPGTGASYGSQPQYYGGGESHGKATASMICGIIGIFIAGLILGIIAIVLGNSAKRDMEAQPGRYGNRGQAQAGFVLGIIDIVLWAIILISWTSR